MAFPKNLRIVFKTVSTLMVGIFLWQQVVWAGDLINAALEQQYKDQSQTFAPSYLQNQQNAAENLVNQKQAIADSVSAQNLTNSTNIQPPPDTTLDLKGPRGGGQVTNNATVQMVATTSSPFPQNEAILSITTQAGDIINYKNNAIDSIQKKDDTIVKNIILDQNNNLLGAQITHPDGSVQIVSNGKTSQVIKPDGTILNYNTDELISSIVYPDGTTVNCSYTKDSQGNIIDTILTDSKKPLITTVTIG